MRSSLAGRFAEAHSLYTEAYDKFAELKAPLIAAEVGLWSSYHQTTFPLLSFTGHSGRVTSVAIAPDGRTALSGSSDKTLKLWDLASGKELRTFTGHSGRVTSVAIAPDGRTALSGSCGQDAEALGPGQRKRAAHLHRALRCGEQRRHCPGRPNRALGELRTRR